MRTAIILVLLCFSVAAMAEQSNFRSKLTSLLNMQAKAADAIDSALQLLRDLKQANIDAQEQADEVNRTQEQNLGKQIADLLFIADQNKAAGNQATDYRKHIQNEIASTQDYLTWINNRRREIHQKREDLRKQRCISNMMFVKGLKAHQEALEVITWLKEDVLGIVNGAGSSDLAQIKSSATRLQAYAHLFNEQALNEFAQLSQSWEDNDREGLQLDAAAQGTASRNVGDALVKALDDLQQHLQDAIDDLESSEIEGAWNLATWLHDSEAEEDHLDEEEAKKTTYMDGLLITIIGAKAHEDATWEIYFESAATYNNAVEDLEQRRDDWREEKDRRDEENQILDEVIKMFVDRVTGLDSGIRNKMDTGADLYRRTDDAYARDFGRVAGNVASEAAAF